MKDGYKGIRVKEEIYKAIEEEYKARKMNMAISKWIGLLLESEAVRNKLLRKYLSDITIVGSFDNSLIMKDKSMDGIIEVKIDKLKPFCKSCKKDNCKHAYYALITPELALIERAWRDLNPRPTG